MPVISEAFEIDGLEARGIKLPRGVDSVDTDSHIRVSPYEVLAKLRPAFGGVQTGGNSSAIVDGAGAVLVASSAYAKANGSYIGEIVELSVDVEKRVKLHKVTVVIDCGTAVNPRNIRSQLEGGVDEHVRKQGQNEHPSVNIVNPTRRESYGMIQRIDAWMVRPG